MIQGYEVEVVEGYIAEIERLRAENERSALVMLEQAKALDKLTADGKVAKALWADIDDE